MSTRVTTQDGVEWEVQRHSPFTRARDSDDVRVNQDQHIGFEALFMIGLSFVGVISLPAIVQSDYWWLVFVVGALTVSTWFMYVAKWHVLMLREGQIVHRTHVRGRRLASALMSDFAEEIARSTDASLTGQDDGGSSVGRRRRRA